MRLEFILPFWVCLDFPSKIKPLLIDRKITSVFTDIENGKKSMNACDSAKFPHGLQKSDVFHAKGDVA